MKYFVSILCVIVLFNTPAFAQEPQFPIVKGFGGIYQIDDVVEQLVAGKKVKIVVELVSGNETPEQYSFWVNNIARLMNLHGIEGVSSANLDVKVIVHGPAVFDLLSHGNYFEKYKIPKNPNIVVWEALAEAGADVIVCGQSLVARELGRNEIWKNTLVATSALTTITKNVADGYVLLKF
ncbi:Intracellular sulfur oxidation protein, DsrE/DsrF family [Marivirga sericea]|uniref:Intracellular sulfur oxidation protein, DsrE/DsrF family n=1 Tax=Marivirga sericea TaxID=1028 RepID=A0A1X7KD03_9BACT|nr:DsrE family protein [Marivirga sericea]SMG39102.1 Intracellular sulfur oxidation protein, DsrE/DsrF family [Marivirga sericea]